MTDITRLQATETLAAYAGTIYAHIGGDATIRQLVDRFYGLMDTLPEAWELRKQHPEDLSGSADKLYDYFSGWLGGPPRFIEKHGQPFLRRRHLPFQVGKLERDQWMMCMEMAAKDVLTNDEVCQRFLEALGELATHMQNRA